MNLVRLLIQGQQSVDGTFDYSAALVGDAVLYNVNKNGKPLGQIQTALVPDAGDSAPPGIEVQDDSLLGVTSTGRPVLAFRSGNRKPNSTEWDGTSSLYIGVGAASALRPPAQSVVVQVSQPGPAGPQGPPGIMGPRGMTGPAGKDGLDGEDAFVDDETIDKIAARVWTLEAGPHAGISGTDLGTMAQQNIAYPFTQRQDVKVQELVREDEAIAGMKASGFVPKGV